MKNKTITIPESPKFSEHFRHSGLSQDNRANRWRYTCPCGRTADPSPTMLKDQSIECRCGTVVFVDYNAETVQFRKSEY